MDSQKLLKHFEHVEKGYIEFEIKDLMIRQKCYPMLLEKF